MVSCSAQNRTHRSLTPSPPHPCHFPGPANRPVCTSACLHVNSVTADALVSPSSCQIFAVVQCLLTRSLPPQVVSICAINSELHFPLDIPTSTCTGIPNLHLTRCHHHPTHHLLRGRGTRPHHQNMSAVRALRDDPRHHRLQCRGTHQNRAQDQR